MFFQKNLKKKLIQEMLDTRKEELLVFQGKRFECIIIIICFDIITIGNNYIILKQGLIISHIFVNYTKLI